MKWVKSAELCVMVEPQKPSAWTADYAELGCANGELGVTQNTACALIDLAALRDNLNVVRRLCPQSRILAMVKANAYGHGLLSVARTLNAADGFAVARLQEA